MMNPFKKGDGFVCQKLKELHDLRPDDVLQKYHQAQAPHIDTKEILRKIGIHCAAVDFAPLEEALFLSGNDAVLGIACSEGDNVTILYSDKLDDCDINYVLAHELAHCCLHLPVSTEFHVEMKTQEDFYSLKPTQKQSQSPQSRDKADKAKEDEADVFAANLLVPTDALIEFVLDDGDSVPTIATIAKHFGVPDHLVSKKIAVLSAESST